jgi:hypothetical protein
VEILAGGQPLELQQTSIPPLLRESPRLYFPTGSTRNASAAFRAFADHLDAGAASDAVAIVLDQAGTTLRLYVEDVNGDVVTTEEQFAE